MECSCLVPCLCEPMELTHSQKHKEKVFKSPRLSTTILTTILIFRTKPVHTPATGLDLSSRQHMELWESIQARRALSCAASAPELDWRSYHVNHRSSNIHGELLAWPCPLWRNNLSLCLKSWVKTLKKHRWKLLDSWRKALNNQGCCVARFEFLYDFLFWNERYFGAILFCWGATLKKQECCNDPWPDIVATISWRKWQAHGHANGRHINEEDVLVYHDTNMSCMAILLTSIRVRLQLLLSVPYCCPFVSSITGPFANPFSLFVRPYGVYLFLGRGAKPDDN